MTVQNNGAEKAVQGRAVLAHFVNLGEQLSDERHVIHFFYDGDVKALRTVLEKQGYRTRDTAGTPGLIAERNEVTDEAWLDTTMHMMCSLADEFGCEYDGWEASAIRQANKPAPKKSLFGKLFGKPN